MCCFRPSPPLRRVGDPPPPRTPRSPDRAARPARRRRTRLRSRKRDSERPAAMIARANGLAADLARTIRSMERAAFRVADGTFRGVARLFDTPFRLSIQGSSVPTGRPRGSRAGETAKLALKHARTRACRASSGVPISTVRVRRARASTSASRPKEQPGQHRRALSLSPRSSGRVNAPKRTRRTRRLLPPRPRPTWRSTVRRVLVTTSSRAQQERRSLRRNQGLPAQERRTRQPRPAIPQQPRDKGSRPLGISYSSRRRCPRTRHGTSRACAFAREQQPA